MTRTVFLAGAGDAIRRRLVPFGRGRISRFGATHCADQDAVRQPSSARRSRAVVGRERVTLRRLLLIGALIASPFPASAQSANKIFEAELPNVPGKSMTSLIVDYAPGGASKPHRHAESGFIFAYVLSGSIRSQVEGEPVKVYQAGEYWIEGPGAHHVISENASETEPARLLAVFVADEGDTLTTFDE